VQKSKEIILTRLLVLEPLWSWDT